MCGLLLTVGCASYQQVRMVSDPPGAEVRVDGDLVGSTPLDVRLMRDRDHIVFVKKEGYKPEQVVLTKRTASDGRFFLTPADVFVDLSMLLGGRPEAEREDEASKAGGKSSSGRPARTGSAQERERERERRRDLQIKPDEKKPSPGASPSEP